MTLWRLVVRSLWYYRRTHLGVVAGAAIGTAVLVGALLVGDSVRGTLDDAALARIGRAHLAISSGERFFRTELAAEIGAEVGTDTAAMILVRGVATVSDGNGRANDVQIAGVADDFRLLAPESSQAAIPPDDAVFLNQRLAQQLNVTPGQRVVLRIDMPQLLPRDVPLASGADRSISIALTVGPIVSDAGFGRFGLRANQIPPYNAFVSRSMLAKRLAMTGKANLLLLGDTPIESAGKALRKRLQLADLQLELTDLDGRGVELRSDRVFIDELVRQAVASAGSTEILTWFVNELRKGERSTPYSIVTAMAGPVTSDLEDDEVLINAWLAAGLDAGEGDWVDIVYYVPASGGSGGKLVERSSRFRVRAVVPMDHVAMDRTLMPAYPGMTDVDHCRDWEIAAPIDLARIRDKDEQYWRQYRGTPKAILKYETGAALWGSRFGQVTAIRFPSGIDVKQNVTVAIVGDLDPAAVGLPLVDIRTPALAASSEATDFGGLFLSMSFFLIVAAVVLTGLLFVFGVDQRRTQTGTLLALGLTRRQVQRLSLLEGLVLAIAGALVGTAAGVLYTILILQGLDTIWSGAVTAATIKFHAHGSTLITGGCAGVLIAWCAIWFALWRQARRSTSELLGGVVPPCASQRQALRSGRGLWIAVSCIAVAVVLLLTKGVDDGMVGAGMFFAVGALVLTAAIATSGSLLARLGKPSVQGGLSLFRLGARQCARRPGRSLAIVALLASGTFLVVAVGANRQDPSAIAYRRESGTGGFALFGSCTLPVMHDLDTVDGRAAFGIDKKQMRDVNVVAMKVRAGDDASCLNLSRSQTPTLMGVDPEALDQPGAFTFVKTIDDTAGAWSLLTAEQDEGVIPAIGDDATVTWALGRSVGDTMAYVDEAGRTFHVRIVATIGNSILQGGLIIAERRFQELFPSQSGHRMFLIDAPPATSADVAAVLSDALSDLGLEITATSQRLAMFNEVQNTYLSIFQALGGLGVALGCVGLGMVVMRNVLERRSELALLAAVGFEKPSVHRLLISEHALLVVPGVAGGVLAAVVAVWPALNTPQAHVPYLETVVTISVIGASAFVWAWLAAVIALRGPLLASLRSE